MKRRKVGEQRKVGMGGRLCPNPGCVCLGFEEPSGKIHFQQHRLISASGLDSLWINRKGFKLRFLSRRGWA